MNLVAWARAFAGGVADAESKHSLWREASGRLVAVRLTDGQVLWRSAEPLLPLLLGHGLALGLALAPARVVALALDEAGTERWRSDALPWPEWAARRDAPPSSVTLHAGWLDERILLRWCLRPLYTGGAAPGPSRVKAAAVSGACLLDAASGTLLAAPTGFDRPPPEPAPHNPSDDPTVLTQQVLGGVRYRLQLPQRPETLGRAQGTELVAHDLESGHDLWRCVLDDTPRKAPRALRP